MRTLPLLSAAALVLAASASTGTADRSGGATARAWGVKIVVPGQADTGTRLLAAPGDNVAFDGPYAFPADGSVVSVSSVTTSVTASSGAQAIAQATAEVTSLSLFKGDLTATTVTGETHALASSGSASGDTGTTAIDGLVVLGQPVTPTANEQIPLADWGYAIALEQKGQDTRQPAPGYHDFVTALDVFLTADHGGLPAGSELQIGYAEADAQAAEGEPLPLAPSEPITTTPAQNAGNGKPSRLLKPLTVTPKLGQTGYAFPVYGNSGFADTFGALRSDVPGGWHHGDDIFAPLGTPVLAVAHGTIFSVGWNRTGGWRLWLRDDKGNEFYYAHLSAYSPLAVDGAIVNAADVIGFVGNTGDAQHTPYHLHFEVHPVGLLALGYDGAVDPTTYLHSWPRPQSVRFEAAAGWLPRGLSVVAPKAGAVLLQESDISTASGLDPGSLSRAAEGAGGPPLEQPPASRPVVS